MSESDEDKKPKENEIPEKKRVGRKKLELTKEEREAKWEDRKKKMNEYYNNMKETDYELWEKTFGKNNKTKKCIQSQCNHRIKLEDWNKMSGRCKHCVSKLLEEAMQIPVINALLFSKR